MDELQQTSGFEYMDEESIDPELKCSICTDPFIDPVVISSCNHTFCRSDIERVLMNNPACPLCRYEPISSDELQAADLIMLDFLNRLLVKCNTCNEINIQRGLFNEHIGKICPKVQMRCSAADLTCGWTGPRDQLTGHLAHCTFEQMRPILGHFLVMAERLEQNQLENQELKLIVNGLNHRCKQLEMKIQGPAMIPLRSAEIHINAKWTPNGLTIMGGNGCGDRCDQLYHPQGLYLHDNQTLYVADFFNHRIVEWKSGQTSGKIVAGGNGQGNRNDQLKNPSDVIVDKERNCLIICDRGNRRVVRWSLQGSTSGETIISYVDCNCLTMDDKKSLYLTDIAKNEVRLWRLGETQGVVVAGGNGQGDRLDQLNYPTFIFVDRDYSVYVSDYKNHRVMRWAENAKEGVVVAGGRDEGNLLSQSNYPGGVVVDQWGTVYVADSESHRVMRWPKGAKEGTVIAGGNDRGAQPNKLNRPSGLLFDQHGNLYVADYGNHRIQKFEIDTNSS